MSSASRELKAYARMGAIIKRIRQAAGLSQMALAEKIGVSYQQVQKYERGSSRIAVTRLMRVAEALDVPVEAFLEVDEGPERFDPEEAKLLAAFRAIKADPFRRAAIEMLRTMGRLGGAPS